MVYFLPAVSYVCLPFMLEAKLCFIPVPEGRLMGSQLQIWRFRSVGTFGVQTSISLPALPSKPDGSGPDFSSG